MDLGCLTLFSTPTWGITPLTCASCHHWVDSAFMFLLNELFKMPVDLIQNWGHIRVGHAAKGLASKVQPSDEHSAVMHILSDVPIVLEPSFKCGWFFRENLFKDTDVS